MTELEKLRTEIDLADRNLAKAFVQRMELCKKIGEYKRINSLPIRDSKRETDIIESKGKLCGEYRSYGERLYRTLIDLSCELQESIDG